MKKCILHPASFKLDGGAMFGIIPKPLWSKCILPDEHNRIKMSLRLIYIETRNKKILIDTGIGDYHSQKFNSQLDIQGEASPLESALKTHLGVKPFEITDIILTHLHFDHVGGLGRGEGSNQLIFPNATVHLHENHFKYAKSPGMRDKGSFQDHFFLPLLEQYKKNNRLNFLTQESGTILRDEEEEIHYKISHGHTPYMLHPIFENFIFMADLVPTSHHIKIPWVMGYDINPGITTEYKKKFYDYIIQHQLKLIFEHDNNTWGGALRVNEKNQYELFEIYQSSQECVQLIDHTKLAQL